MAETLLIGPLRLLEENIIYRMPSRRTALFCTTACEVSNDVTFATSASLAGSTYHECAAQYIRTTTSPSAIKVVA